MAALVRAALSHTADQAVAQAGTAIPPEAIHARQLSLRSDRIRGRAPRLTHRTLLLPLVSQGSRLGVQHGSVGEAFHFTWLRGTEQLRFYESSPGKRRYFCGNCGTQLVAQREGVCEVILRVATLDEDPGQVPQFHIWASAEVPWLQYGPHIAAYPEWEPGH